MSGSHALNSKPILLTEQEAADALRAAVKSTDMRQWTHLEDRVDGRAMMSAHKVNPATFAPRRGAAAGGRTALAAARGGSADAGGAGGAIVE